MRLALKLITNFTPGHWLVIVAQELAVSRKNRIREALKQFIAVDDAMALVTMGELALYTSNFSAPPLMEEDWVVLCQTLFQVTGLEER